jgi:rhodanese-related sulfurtransferase
LRLPRLWWLPAGRVPEIKAEDLKQWLDEGRPLQLVDARTALEFRQGTIADALHAPLTEMPGSIQRLDLQTGVPVVVLCLSGHRSLPGTRWLRARGYEAYSLQGGILAWKRAGLDLNPPGRSL